MGSITIVILAFALSVNGAIPPFLRIINPHASPASLNDSPASAASATTSSARVLETVTQRVNNFDPQNTATFNQRYHVSEQFFQPGGPLFITIGGEVAITEYILTDSLMADMARDANAAMFYLEQRYYGESFPVPDVSFDNFRYFTPDQVLADIAHFVAHIRGIYGNGPVVIMGSEYAASLAVWFRQKYPHLSVGAWASSAPLQAEVNHMEFKEIVGDIYRQVGGNECYNAIESGFRAMEELAVSNVQQLASIFRLCDPLENHMQVTTFFLVIAELFAYQLNYGAEAVHELCHLIEEPGESDAHRIARIIPDEYICIPIEFDIINELLQDVALDSFGVQYGYRQTTYKYCLQTGWLQTSDSAHQPFGSSFPIEFFYDECEIVFGENFNNVSLHENVDRHNVLHGGINPDVTNVIFTHGTLDPWQSIGVMTDLNESSPSIAIADAARSFDIAEVHRLNSLAVLEAKVAIRRFVEALIS